MITHVIFKSLKLLIEIWQQIIILAAEFLSVVGYFCVASTKLLHEYHNSWYQVHHHSSKNTYMKISQYQSYFYNNHVFDQHEKRISLIKFWALQLTDYTQLLGKVLHLTVLRRQIKFFLEPGSTTTSSNASSSFRVVTRRTGPPSV